MDPEIRATRSIPHATTPHAPDPSRQGGQIRYDTRRFTGPFSLDPGATPPQCAVSSVADEIRSFVASRRARLRTVTPGPAGQLFPASGASCSICQ